MSQSPTSADGFWLLSASPELLRIGSRESPLALAQAHYIADALQQAWPELKLEIRTFKTKGDLILDTALSKAGDKGLFVKELEAALLADEIDLAVHSMKDMPGAIPAGLTLVSAGEREDPRDVLLSRDGRTFLELPSGAVIGTSSLRREAQLRRLRPDLTYRVVRGNLQTRWRKLEEGNYDALVLAAAGVNRLGWMERVTQAFDAWTETIPAVAQGILGIEFRENDARVMERLKPLQLQVVEVARLAERAVLAALNGGCQVPLGAYCRETANGFEMRGIVLSLDGSRCVTAEVDVSPEQPVAAGEALAAQLLSKGARDILASIHENAPVDSP
jgi:hydroxymethylbilane synthase